MLLVGSYYSSSIRVAGKGTALDPSGLNLRVNYKLKTGQRRSKQDAPFRRNELWLCEEAVPEEPRKRLDLVDEAGAGACRRNLPCPCRAAARVAALVQMRHGPSHPGWNVAGQSPVPWQGVSQVPLQMWHG